MPDKSKAVQSHFLFGATMNKLIWHVKQLLPLQYQTTYTDTATGQRILTVWRMWFGRCFWVQEWELK